MRVFYGWNYRRIWAIWVTVVSLLIILYVHRGPSGEKMREDTFIVGKMSRRRNKTNIGPQKCTIPTVDPFDKEIVKYLKPSVWESCDMVRYGRVENNTLRFGVENVLSAYVSYIERVDDFKNKFSPTITIFGKGITIFGKALTIFGKAITIFGKAKTIFGKAITIFGKGPIRIYRPP